MPFQEVIQAVAVPVVHLADVQGFTPLEYVLMSALGFVVGAVCTVAAILYKYMKTTGKERSAEIKSAVTVQLELKSSIDYGNKLVEGLPDLIHDKIKIALQK